MTNTFSRAGEFIRSPRFPIFMIVFVDVLGLGITIPVLPLFAQNQLHADAWQITALTSVYFTAQFFASPWLGRLSDRVGRRPVLIFSQLGTLAALLMTGSAPAIFLLYVARTIDGLTGGNISVAQAYLSDITDEKNRARGLGLVNASFGLGFVFGPAFGSLVAAYFGPRVPFFVAAGMSFITILLSTFLLPESLPPERRKREQAVAALAPRGRGLDLLRIPAIAILLLIAFGSQVGFFSFQTVFVLWMKRLVFPGQPDTFVQQAIGAIFTFVGLFGIATQFWLIGPAVKRFGEKKLVIGGNLARGVAFGIMALAPTVFTVVPVIPLVAMGGGFALPATIALLTYAAPPGERGQAIGLFQSVSALGSILGPLLAGFLFETVHPNAPMIAAAIVMGLTTLVGLNLFRFPLHQSIREKAPAQTPL
jgi:DHA1 family tetracycline resistance protein-like MFS transporter